MSDQDDAQRVWQAIRSQLKVHARVEDQALAADSGSRDALANIMPALRAFGTNRYASVHAVLDWDHQLPSRFIALRIYASYSEHEGRVLDTKVRAREQEIQDANVYPEFDVPDYGDFEASESYVAIVPAGTDKIEELRFLSPWRKQVGAPTARMALGIVKAHVHFTELVRARQNDALGGAVVIGWTPPCLADAEHWAVEVWLLTEFDGTNGKAHVFMVDAETHRITREFDTDIQVA